MCMFLGLKKWNNLFEDEHRLEPSLVHMQVFSEVTAVLVDRYIWNQSVLCVVPWFIQTHACENYATYRCLSLIL